MPFGGRNSIFRKPLGTGRNSVSNKLKELEEKVRKINDNISREAQAAAGNIRRETSRASGQLGRALTRAKDDLNRELTWAKEDINDELTDSKESLDREAARLKQEIDREATKAKRNIDKEATRAKGKADAEAKRLKAQVDKEVDRAKENIDRELTRLKEDLDREATRLKQDLDRELISAKEDVDEAIAASTTFVEHNMQSLNETISETGELISEGKVLDALAHAATEPYKDTSGAYVAAVSESKLLAQAASAVITAYGGPAAGAAYSAWLTYEMTGNLDAAIQAGVISAASAQGGEFVNGLPTETISDQVMQEVARASVNAAAVAVSGGSKEDIEEAFMSTVTNTAQAKAQSAIQLWVKTEIAPKFSMIGKPDMVEIDNKSLIDKAHSLNEDIEAFRKEYEHLVRAALDTEEFIREQAEKLIQDDAEAVVEAGLST